MEDFETEIFLDDLKTVWIKKTVPIIHCGAHLAEEANIYHNLEYEPVTWIEAAPNLISQLRNAVQIYPKNYVVSAALWSQSGLRMTFRIANNGYSSSFREFGTHAFTYPEIDFVGNVELITTTLDELNLFPGETNIFLVLDLQGVEYEALLGASKLLARCEYVYTGVSRRELYQGERSWEELSKLLETFNFHLVDWQYSEEKGWGNALYSRHRLAPRNLWKRKSRRRLHKERIRQSILI